MVNDDLDALVESKKKSDKLSKRREEELLQKIAAMQKCIQQLNDMSLLHLLTQKAHTPVPDTHVINYSYDIKKWIEPCLNNLKNHIYPHTYKFTKRNVEVMTKYKQWATDESWLPEGPGHQILAAKKPEGAPSLVRPDTHKMMEVNALADCVKKCKRLTADQKEWWAEFVNNEKRYRQKWKDASEDYLGRVKESRWYLDKLRRHKPVAELQVNDPDQQQRESTLENLLDKANKCPEVCFERKEKQSHSLFPELV